jgi:hypothetical protein
MESSGSGESRVERRVQYVDAGTQESAGMCRGQALHVVFRCNAGPLSEETMEVGGTEIESVGKLLQAGLPPVSSGKVADHPRHARIVIHQGLLRCRRRAAHPILAAIFWRVLQGK